jgi:4-hydroxyacetophenone monooxygenase
MLWPMRITGRDGADLHELWGERPAAYLGITITGFPNLFCLYGPGTNLAHGGSLIFHSECQMRYVSGCLRALIDGAHRTIEPRQERLDDWHQRSQDELRNMVWSQPSVRHSYYKNSHGEIHVLSPWRIVDYWSWTREPDLGDYVFG